jgi:ADP-ribose pyrophosphatase
LVSRRLGERVVRRTQHGHEVIEVHWLDYRQALEKAQNGEIEDGKTLIGLLRAAPLLA